MLRTRQPLPLRLLCTPIALTFLAALKELPYRSLIVLGFASPTALRPKIAQRRPIVGAGHSGTTLACMWCPELANFLCTDVERRTFESIPRQVDFGKFGSAI